MFSIVFSKKQNLGRRTLRKYVSDACNECGFKGEGITHGMVLHGLRGTVVLVVLVCSKKGTATLLLFHKVATLITGLLPHTKTSEWFWIFNNKKILWVMLLAKFQTRVLVHWRLWWVCKARRLFRVMFHRQKMLLLMDQRPSRGLITLRLTRVTP